MLAQRVLRAAARNNVGPRCKATSLVRLQSAVSAAHVRQRRFASSDGGDGGGMNERHVQLLGLRMDALKQNKLSEDDLQVAFDNTVSRGSAYDSRYFRAVEALDALKLVVRHGTQELVGLRGGAKVAREWPAFHPEEMSQLGAATESRPAPRGIAIGLAAGIAPMPVHAGDRVRVERGSYQGKFATVVRPTAARYIVRLDRGGEVCLAPSSLLVQQAVNARTLAAAEGKALGPVGAPLGEARPANWVSSAGGMAAPVLASAASELSELHAWLGRDESEKDWDPVAL